MWSMARCWAFIVWVWVSASQRILLSVLAWNPHKGLTREISYETGRRREKARSPGSQQKKVVSDGKRKEAAERWVGPVDQECRSTSGRGWVSAPGSCVENFVRVHARDSTEAQNASKVPKTSPFLRLGLSQVRACLFFFLPLSVMYVASVVCL